MKIDSKIDKFSETFLRDILQSELLRVRILMFIFGFTAFAFSFLTFFFIDYFFVIYQFYFPKYLPIGFFGSITLFYFLLSKRIEFAIKKKLEVSNLVRYFSCFVEVSFPTLAIFFLGKYYQKPILGLITPPEFVYFLFIILSALRLDQKISILTGALSGLSYLGLSLYSIQISKNIPGIDPLFLAPQIYIAKSLMLLITGISAGFVTKQILKKIYNSFEVLEERNRITGIFGQHVSPSVVDKLLNQTAEFHSESKHLCMMFFDIRDFTKFSENRNPEEVVNYLNSIFENIIDIINKHNGIINKFLGDGFMAVFGAPISSTNDVENAVSASLEILEKINSLSLAGKILPTKIGIGLHCGTAVTGNVGSSSRKEYTIIGDVVNLASRIEQLNKQFNSTILMSEEVYSSLAEKKGELVGEVEVKGRVNKVKVYRLA